MRALLSFLLLTGTAHADDALIEDAVARHDGGDWTFSVTLSHGDTGWDDYADGWRVVMADGTVLGTRVLLHPHVNEQPFTRSMGGISVPEGISEIYIEASTNTDGWGTVRFPMTLK